MSDIKIKNINNTSKRMIMLNDIYYLSVILLTIKVVLISSELIVLNELIDNTIFAISIILIATKMVLLNKSLFDLILIGMIGIICLYTGIKSGSYHIFISYLIIAGSYKSDMKKMIKCILYTLTIMILTHLVVYLINMLFNNVEISSIVKQGEFVSTHSFYLGHSNTASMYILWTILGFIYLNYDNLTINKIIVYSALMISNYYFTRSRTCIIISILMISMIFLDKYILKNSNKIFKNLSKYGFIIISLITITLCKFYDKFSFISIINKLFSGRLLLSYFALKTYGYTLFGQFIDFTVNYGVVSNWSVTRLAIDIMPLRLIINYGVFYLIVYSLLLLKSNKYALKKEHIFITLMIFYSLMEIFTMNAVVCFPLAICGWYIINNNSIKSSIIKR